MPHYFRLERYTCGAPGCRKPAEGTVFNGQNAPCGKFCERHGEAAVAELNGLGVPLDRPNVRPPQRQSWADRLR
jgi:hypothetical protein